MLSTETARVLIVVAYRLEAEAALCGLNIRGDEKLPYGRLYDCERDGRPFFVLKSGVGPEFATSSLQEVLRRAGVSHVVSTGTAGALRDGLRIGETIQVREYVDADGGLLLKSPEGCSSYFTTAARLVTSARPVEKTWERLALRERTGADVVDMESTALMHVSREAGLPFVCVRTISDVPEERSLGSSDGWLEDVPAALESLQTFVDHITGAPRT